MSKSRKFFQPFVASATIFIAVLLSTLANAQCTTGSEPECACDTAPVLCTIDELDNFSFSMDPFLHPNDGPSPLCPGFFCSCVPNNPTWFAFTVWCTDLDIEVNFSNCQAGSGSTTGVQVAIYSSCAPSYNAVDCNVNAGDCDNNDPKILNLTNLTIGATYYFIVDGCSGSYCDIDIDVLGVCGSPMIEDWTLGIDGEIEVCAGDTEIYDVEDLEGADLYHWYIDGTEVSTTGISQFTNTWTTPGTYTLCADASNDPCIPVTADPAQICVTVNVFESASGDIVASPDLLCPGESSAISITNSTAGPNHTSVILFTSPTGIIEDIITTQPINFTVDSCDIFEVCAFTYVNSIGPIPMIGDDVNSYDCVADCCYLDCTSLAFIDEVLPVFPSTPADDVLECYFDLIPMTDLTWTDDCEGTGTVPGVESGSADLCSGGMIIRMWEFADKCDNLVQHTQTLTISPLVLPTFTAPPANETVSCVNAPSGVPADLTYTNNGTGNCLLTDDVPVSQDIQVDLCGGTITNTWEFTDSCMNVVNHIQVITVEAAPIASFVNPPGNMTVDCIDLPTGPVPDLMVDNNESGTCEISEPVMGTSSGMADVCGGMIVYTWTFMDQCGRSIQHDQIFTVNPAPIATFVNPPGDLTISCDAIPTDLPPDLIATNNETGTCEINEPVPVMQTGSADECGGTIINTWMFTDPCGRTITHTQTITVDPAPQATFVNPPSDITVDCANLPTGGIPDLMVTNNEVGNCEISDPVIGTSNGMLDVCGGTVTYTWTHVDDCGRTEIHEQMITVDPIPMADFVNPPGDITITCDDIPTDLPPDLIATNNESGNCEINEPVPVMQTGTADECGGTLINTWMFTDQCGRTISHTQTITVTPAPPAAFTNLPGNITMDCETYFGYTIENLDYTNSGMDNCEILGSAPPSTLGFVDECGGSQMVTWTFMDNCGRTISHQQTITVDPAPPAMFINPPTNIIVECADFDPNPPSLDVSNGLTDECEIIANINPQVFGDLDPCGSQVEYLWVFMDDCGRTINHNQIVTILPAPSPQFINLPGNLVLACEDVPTGLPTLQYDNNATGDCNISDSVTATESGGYDECGGLILYTFNYSDNCNNITYVQSVTVEPAPDAMFVNPPADDFLPCGTSTNNPPSLIVDNGLLPPCDIYEIINPATTINGNLIVNTWGFTNPCSGNYIEHVQTVTISTEPDLIIFDNNPSICQGESFDLTSLVIVDNNNSNPTYTYHNGTPSDQNILVNTTVSPFVPQIYYVVGTNSFGCSDMVMINLNVDLPVQGADDGTAAVCNDGTLLDFFAILNDVQNVNGFWLDPQGSGINLNDPFAVNVSSLSAGTYFYDYVLSTTNSCPDDTATLELILLDAPSLTILSSDCTADNQFYTLTLNSDQALDSGTASVGNFTLTGSFQIEISDIPIDQSVTIDVVAETGCTNQLTLNPPICDCPDVPLPIWNGDGPFCVADLPVTLTVDLEPGHSANWFSDASGTDVLIADSASYSPNINAAGNYTYYVQSFNTTIPECVSLTLTEVNIEVIAEPVLNAATLTACDDDDDGMVAFDLSLANAQISSDGSLMFEYFLTMGDAQSGMNPLPNPFSNSVANTQTLFVSASDPFSCSAITSLELVVDPLPVVNLNISNETCAGDNDGSIMITPTAGAAPFMTSLDGANFTSDLSYTNLDPGNYQLYVQDDKACENIFPFDIAEGQDLALMELMIVCNDNGTDTDPNDDFYTISFIVTDVVGNIEYNLTINGGNSTAYDYGNLIEIELPADGNNYELLFEDQDTGCSIVQALGDLTPCSTNCEISILQLDYVCNGNGTPIDPSDDFYDITVNATVVNGGANGIYNVAINGTNSFNFLYDTPGNFTLPADGSSPIIAFIDNEIIACQSNQTIGPLVACSDQCILSADYVAICDDMGTLNDSSDDVFTVELVVSGINASSGWSGPNGLAGDYDITSILGPFLITDGDIQLTLSDNDDADCFTTIDIIAPPHCSDPCEIEVSTFDIGPCNDNGTGDDETDDFFALTLTVTSTLGNVDQYLIELGSELFGPFDYDSSIAVDSLPADASMLAFSIYDIANGQCVTDFVIMAPPPCSSCDQTVEAGDNQELDCLNTTADLMASASETASYSWVGPNFFSSDEQSVSVGSPGIYVVTALFSDGCMATDSLEITVDGDIPIANAGPDQLLNCVNDSVALEAIILNSNNILIEWSDANGNIISNEVSFFVDLEGSYFLQLIDTLNNCSSALDEVLVTENMNVPDAVIYADPDNQIDCVVTSINITTDPQADVVFIWSIDGLIIPDAFPLNITEPGLIGLEVIDTISGCNNTASLEITDIQDFPLAMINPADNLDCINLSSELTAVTSQITDDIIYNWLDANQVLLAGDTESYTIMNEGWYFLEVIDTTNLCSNLDSIFIEDISEVPILTAGQDQSLACGLMDTTLEAQLDGDPSDYDIQWSSTSGQFVGASDELSVAVTGAGTYVISVLNLMTNCSASDSVVIVLTDGLGAALFDAADVNCFGENDGSLDIGDVQGGQEPYMYALNNGPLSNETNYENLGPGTYDLQIIDDNGCSLDTSFVITEPMQLLVNLDPELQLEFGETAQLLATVNIDPSEIANISWSPNTNLSCSDCLDPMLTTSEAGSYTITVTDINGCEATANIQIRVEQPVIEIYIPTAFSPNEDNNGNDFFTLYANEQVEEIEEMFIYDRWGELMFYTENIPPNDPSFGWDGRFKNDYVVPGVYVYMFNVRYTTQNTENLSGDITVLR